MGTCRTKSRGRLGEKAGRRGRSIGSTTVSNWSQCGSYLPTGEILPGSDYLDAKRISVSVLIRFKPVATTGREYIGTNPEGLKVRAKGKEEDENKATALRFMGIIEMRKQGPEAALAQL